MKQTKSLLCWFLAICLLLGALPLTAAAASTTEATKATESTQTTEAPNTTEGAEATTAPEGTTPTQTEATDSTESDDPAATTAATEAPGETEAPTDPETPDVTVSGSCGQDAKWTLNETTGLLTISGTGIVSSYSDDQGAPWLEKADKITAVVVSEGITKIGSNAFAGCTKLAKATLADSVLSVGSGLFSGCTALTEVTLPKELTALSIYMFENCVSLKSFSIPDSIQTIGIGAFSGCTGLTEIVIPDTVTQIGATAFNGCTGLTKVTLSSKLTAIAENTFYNCTALTSVSIPEGVKSIGNYAFYNCSKLASVTLPKTLTAIGDSAFYNCAALTAITLPQALTEIGANAFARCGKLTKVSFPEKLTAIDSAAFSNCTGITQLDFAGNAPKIEKDAFTKVKATAYYPVGNKTWASAVKESYGGEITWQAICLGEHKDVKLEGKKDSTCDQAGYTGDKVCQTCGYVVEKGKELAALEHTLADLKPIHNAGTKTHAFYCTTCKQNVDKDCTYSGGKIIQQATLGQPGLKQFTCTLCGGIYTTEYTLESTSERIYGDNRYETSFEIADALKQNLGIAKFDTVVVANGMGFPDALSGSYLACVKNAPILLTNDKNLDSLKAYIQENVKAGGTVYLLGGTMALPKALESELKGFTVKRLYGSDRYETNLAILQEADVGGKEILVCTGTSFADSLSASAANRPILLVGKTLNDYQKQFLSMLDGSNKLCIIGGTSAVSAALEKELEAYGPVERIGGNNRYETSVLVAHTFVSAPEAVVLAYAKKFPDGLCGGPLAFNMGIPLILTADGQEAAAKEYVQSYKISSNVILGGPGLISDKTVKNIFD